MTTQEREEFEQDLREEARIEAAHEYAMAEDSDYAEQWLTDQLSKDFIDTYHFLKKECYKYGINHTDLLNNL